MDVPTPFLRHSHVVFDVVFDLAIIRPATSPDQSEPKISADGACADFVLFQSGPIRC
jgi:hypothetical protein